MRQTISAIAAAIAVMAASAVQAMACGGGGCHYVSPCAQDYVGVPEYSPYYSCAGWGFERLPDPVHQYYYVRNQARPMTVRANSRPIRPITKARWDITIPSSTPIVGTTGDRPATATTGTITATACTAAITDRPFDQAHRFKRAV